MNQVEVLDNKGEITRLLCTNVWSKDRQGNPIIYWWVTFPCGDTFKAPMPVYTEWWS